MQFDEFFIFDDVLVDAAKSMSIKSDKDVENATKILKDLKAEIAKINARWEPEVKKAYAEHKRLKAEQANALKPYEDADTQLRKKVSAYQSEVAAARERAAQELARTAEAERSRLLAEAEAARMVGDLEGAADAEFAADAVPVVSPELAPTPDGLGFVNDIEIEVVDDSLVPVTLGGVMLRPCDMSAIKKLAKAGVTIPGIRVKTVKNVRVY